tara:strand:+ start:72 stop:629 length:558 start_codon:yes stop_codon:yes gene_type:complete
MSAFKVVSRFVILPLSTSALLLAGCAASQANSAQSKEAAGVEKTTKPGAAVTFTHSEPKDLQPGQYGKVVIRVDEEYDTGTLFLTAQPDEGLRLVSETAETSFTMSAGRVHEWELDVTAATDGVYYLNVFANAKLADGTEYLRSYAAKILIGDATQSDIRNSIKANGNLSEDGKTIAMEAEETIQ